MCTGLSAYITGVFISITWERKYDIIIIIIQVMVTDNDNDNNKRSGLSISFAYYTKNMGIPNISTGRWLTENTGRKYQVF